MMDGYSRKGHLFVPRDFDKVSFVLNKNESMFPRFRNFVNRVFAPLARVFRRYNIVTGTKRVTGTLIKENARTVWVRLADGTAIKRHRMKHAVSSLTV